ncbi:MAG: glycoside hydrolase family 43 protein [Lachnospiraceae bacterium]
MNKNGTLWYDTDNNSIQAHGGMIMFHEGIYYWYGENKDGATSVAPSGDIRVDFIGISCYSSKDCVQWKNEGIVLSPSDDPTHDLHKSMVCERPKVIYNSITKEFVMWMHIDTVDYMSARAGVAVSTSPVGPFTYVYSELPNRSDCRDLTVFQDVDKKAYLIYSSDWNKTLCITQLTEDYRHVTGSCTKAFVDQEREAPALFYNEGMYYMITSGCTGWYPNSALYGMASHIQARWKLIENPCLGEHARQTFYGQSAYVFKKDNQFYLLLDHWNPKELKSSGYSMLAIDIKGTELTIPFTEVTFV